MALFRNSPDPTPAGRSTWTTPLVDGASGSVDPVAHRLQRRLDDLEAQPDPFRPPGRSEPEPPDLPSAIAQLSDQLGLLRRQLEDAFAHLEEQLSAGERRTQAAIVQAAAAQAEAHAAADRRLQALTCTIDRLAATYLTTTPARPAGAGDDLSRFRSAIDRINTADGGPQSATPAELG